MELSLAVHERQSPLGKKIAQHLTERLEALRSKNDQAMPEHDRHKIIAQIAETKALLRAFTREPIELKEVAPA